MLSKLVNRARFLYNIKSPLDLKIFKDQESIQNVKISLRKRYRDEKIADQISEMLEHHKKSLYNLEQTNKQINTKQKIMKEAIKNKNDNKMQTEEIQIQLANLRKYKKQLQAKTKDLGTNIEQEVVKIGNIVDQFTPVSQNQEQNVIIRIYEPKSGKSDNKIPYSEICQQANITDLPRGQKVSGHRGYFLKSNGVKLALALTQYAIQFLQQRGYTLYQSPALITQQALKASCQLKTIDQDVYKLENNSSDSSLYLIATSEQTLAGYYKGQVLSKSQLPIRMGGYSTCFRKQAGAHGKDIHGLFRVHQFQKVQQFVITEGDNKKSREQMQKMMNISEEFYKSLGIPYRVVNIVSGELNDAASCKMDLEAWFPSQQRYRQLVSVSNCLDYQSRLLKVQYLGAKNSLQYPHMLNGTLIAIQRTITCLLQNYIKDNHILIPQVLQSYTRCSEFRLNNKNK